MNGSNTETAQHRKSEGQSLVETALFLPILIVMLLGIVEVSTLLVNQNRVTTAGRIAAGYGAANFNGSNWTEIADIMGIVALNSVTDTLDLAPDLWDIWSVHAVVNASGNDFETFNGIHVYGSELIVSQTDWDASVKAQVRNNMLDQLQAGMTEIEWERNLAGLAIVVSIPYHDSSTFLNLPIWQWMNAKTVSGLTAMRVDQPAPFAGCAILPITVRLNQYSVYPSNWNSSEPYHAAQTTAIAPFPVQGEFQNRTPSNPPGWQWPTYVNILGATAPNLDTNRYRNNVPGVHLSNARPGYIYYAREETSSGGFGWITWNEDSSGTDLRASLEYNPPNPPGNFMQLYPGGEADMNALHGFPYQSGDGNGVLEQGEWLKVSTGNINSEASRLLTNYVFSERPITLIYYENIHGGSGGNTYVQVEGFLTVKALGLKFAGASPGQRWIAFEFISWSTECLDVGN